jgi:hypothetical protein
VAKPARSSSAFEPHQTRLTSRGKELRSLATRFFDFVSGFGSLAVKLRYALQTSSS